MTYLIIMTTFNSLILLLFVLVFGGVIYAQNKKEKMKNANKKSNIKQNNTRNNNTNL